MKIIKKGTPYRKHKCSKCKSIYAYHISEDCDRFSNMLYCPVCANFMGHHWYDRKISIKEYNEIKEGDEKR